MTDMKTQIMMAGLYHLFRGCTSHRKTTAYNCLKIVTVNGVTVVKLSEKRWMVLNYDKIVKCVKEALKPMDDGYYGRALEKMQKRAGYDYGQLTKILRAAQKLGLVDEELIQGWKTFRQEIHNASEVRDLKREARRLGFKVVTLTGDEE